jgi:hypothetical protein
MGKNWIWECPQYKGWIRKPAWVDIDYKHIFTPLTWCYLAHFLDGLTIQPLLWGNIQPFIRRRTIMVKAVIRVTHEGGFPNPGLVWPQAQVIDNSDNVYVDPQMVSQLMAQGVSAERIQEILSISEAVEVRGTSPEFGWQQGQSLEISVWMKPGTRFQLRVEVLDPKSRRWRPSLERSFIIRAELDPRHQPNYIDNVVVNMQVPALGGELRLTLKNGKTIIRPDAGFRAEPPENQPVSFLLNKESGLLEPTGAYNAVTTPLLYQLYQTKVVPELKFNYELFETYQAFIQTFGTYAGGGYSLAPGSRITTRTARAISGTARGAAGAERQIGTALETKGAATSRAGEITSANRGTRESGVVTGERAVQPEIVRETREPPGVLGFHEFEPEVDVTKPTELSLVRGKKERQALLRKKPERPSFGESSLEKAGTEHRKGMYFHLYDEAEIAQELRIDYDPVAGRPRRVSYRVDEDIVTREAQTERSFAQDPSIEGAQSRLEGYRGTGLERGHLAMRQAFKRSPEVERAADQFPGVVPMNEYLNRGKGSPWVQAERRTVRYVTPRSKGGSGYSSVHVDVEPIYDAAPPQLKDGTPIPRRIRRSVKAPDGSVLEDVVFQNY